MAGGEAMSLEQKLNNALAGLPLVLAKAAVNWTLENYKRQQWNGTAWPGRKKETSKTRGRALLVQSGRQRRGIQVIGDNSFGVLGVPYARIHNEGGTITHPARTRQMTFKSYKSGKRKGKTLFAKNNTKASFSKKVNSGSYTINIPQRKFIGNSPQLREYLINEVKIYIKSKL